MTLDTAHSSELGDSVVCSSGKFSSFLSVFLGGLEVAQKLEGGLSPRTVQHIQPTLPKVLQDAMSDGLIPRNVANVIKAPKSKKKNQPLSPEQARTFLEAVRADRLEALYVLAVHRGLRQGELLGLRWGKTWTWRPVS